MAPPDSVEEIVKCESPENEVREPVIRQILPLGPREQQEIFDRLPLNPEQRKALFEGLLAEKNRAA